MIKTIPYNEYLPVALESLSAGGAFLTVGSGEELNVMTIGWGTVGYIWNKPIFTVPVRSSRYTYKLIDGVDEFSVSIPLDNSLKEQLHFCGTKSGRDVDKFKECGLIAQPGQVISTPVIGQCPLHYECKIVYKQAMNPGLIAKEIEKKHYQDQNFHTIFYGEIVACYLNR
jgi:flavin reductase (DIM6/NTAB) family NADH-FMN oxidoreductase RutF